MCRDGVGVITSALHAEGRGSDFHSLYFRADAADVH